MRDIKFRAKKLRENGWIIGDLSYTRFSDGRIKVTMWEQAPCAEFNIAIEKETIGQYTGLKDKNGKEIFEGDIVQCNGNKDDLHEVKFGEFKVYDHDTEEAIDSAVGWYFKILDNDIFSNVAPFCYPTPLNNYWIDKIDIKVVGNIFENKDLLE